jgi:protein-disulfide isomerase
MDLTSGERFAKCLRSNRMRPSAPRSFIIAVATLLLAHCAPSNALTFKSEPQIENPTNHAIAEKAQEIYRSSDDLVLGNPSGKVTIVEFFDYNCGYCKRATPQVAKLIESDQDVRVVIKEFPILGPGSIFAAKAALASAKQGKYREFHTALNGIPEAANQTSVLRVAQDVGLDLDKLRTDMESEAVAEIIRKNKNIAQSLSIDGTPTFLFDDTIEPSYASYKVLAQHVATIRRNGGCRFC